MVSISSQHYGICRPTSNIASVRWNVSLELACEKKNQLTICRSQGGATNKVPSTGWTDPRVEVYFDSVASFTSRAPTRALPTQTVTPKPSPSPPHKSKTNIGAIAGGVAGGVLSLLLILLAWFCICRRSKRRQPSHPAPSSAKTEPSTSILTTHYEIGDKPSILNSHTSTSRVTSSSNTSQPHSHQYSDSIQRSPPYTTPPPIDPYHLHQYLTPIQVPIPYYPPPQERSQQPQNHHPAHAPPQPHFAPPETYRPGIERDRMGSYEMPAVRSPPLSR
jgi:hypothetical protein